LLIDLGILWLKAKTLTTDISRTICFTLLYSTSMGVKLGYSD